ncbi:MAG TPA: FHA domain-containing protein [Polyangiales bacterium]
MTGPGPVEQWRKSLEGVTRQQFVVRHPHAFLIWAPKQAADAISHVTNQQMGFHTQVHSSQRRAHTSAGSDDEVLVIPLVKAPGNPFPERISVGRAPNCDIVLRDPSVSKLHGHFRNITPDSAVFTDAKSANGTRHNGATLAAGAAIEVKTFAYLTLGRIRVQLLSSADVYDWL